MAGDNPPCHMFRCFPYSVISLCAAPVLLVSCATSDYTATGVSDAWLDTPVRAPGAPGRPQSTLADLNTGLPSAAPVRAISQQRTEPPPAAPACTERHAEAPRRHAEAPRHVDRGYTGGGYWAASTYRHHHGRHPHSHGVARPGYTRTVEKVGPHILPQPPVPLSTRSYTGGPRLLPRTGAGFVPSVPLRNQGGNDQCRRRR